MASFPTWTSNDERALNKLTVLVDHSVATPMGPIEIVRKDGADRAFYTQAATLWLMDVLVHFEKCTSPRRTMTGGIITEYKDSRRDMQLRKSKVEVDSYPHSEVAIRLDGKKYSEFI